METLLPLAPVLSTKTKLPWGRFLILTDDGFMIGINGPFSDRKGGLFLEGADGILIETHEIRLISAPLNDEADRLLSRT